MKRKIKKYNIGGLTPNGVGVLNTDLNMLSNNALQDMNQLFGSTMFAGKNFAQQSGGIMSKLGKAGGVGSAVSGAASLITDTISNSSKKYDTESQARKATITNTISGIGKGAAAGAAFGPVGIAVGAAAGLLSGAIGGKNKVGDSGFYEDPTIQYGTGIIGAAGRSKAKRQYEELKRKAIGNRVSAQTGLEASSEWLQDYDSENNVFAANGGNIGDLAWLDDGELFKTPDQLIYNVPEQGKPEDSNLLSIPEGTKVLSNKLKVPGTKETFANMAKRLTSKKSKYNDKYALGAAEANAINDKLVFDTLFDIQEIMKGGKKEYKAGLLQFDDGGTKKDFSSLSKWIKHVKGGQRTPNAVRGMWFETYADEVAFNDDLKRIGATRDEFMDWAINQRVNSLNARVERHNPRYKSLNDGDITITPHRNVTEMPSVQLETPEIRGFRTNELLNRFGFRYDNPLWTSEQKKYYNRYIGNGSGYVSNNVAQIYSPMLDWGKNLELELDFSEMDRILNLPVGVLTGRGIGSADRSYSGAPVYGGAPNAEAPTPVKPEIKDVELKPAGISILNSLLPTWLPFIPTSQPKQSTPFDWESLATDITSLLPVFSNLGERPETFASVHNPYANAALNTLGRRRYDVRPTIDAIRRGTASANYAMSQNNTNTGANLAFRLQNAVKANNAITGAYADAAIQNNQYALDYANALNNFGQQYVQARNTAIDQNARSRAQARNINRTGLSQLSNYAQNRLLMRNQRLADQALLDIYEPILSAGFTPDQYARLFEQVSRRG